MIITLYSLSGRLLISTSFSTSEIMSHSFGWNIFLSSHFSQFVCLFVFYALSQLVTFPNLKEVALCRKHPVGLRSMLPSGCQSSVPRGTPYVGCICPSVALLLRQARSSSTVGSLVGRVGPWPGWLPHPASFGFCCPMFWWGQLLAQLATGLGKPRAGARPLVGS